MASPARYMHDTARKADGGNALLVVALLMTALAYLGPLRFGFVYDDNLQIVANHTLTHWSTLPALFTGHSWKFLLPQWPGNYYRPLFMSWLLVNRMLFGLNPAAWHASTVALHLIATSLAFVVARQILGNGTQAGIAAILFGLHPIHVESVAWISGGTDPLMAVFLLAAFWAWFRASHSERHRPWWITISAVLYFAACLSKETALFFPAITIIYEYLFAQERQIVRSTARAWPLLLVAAVYLAVRVLVLRGLDHPVDTPTAHILLTVPTIVWGYLRRLVWPAGLAVFYDTPPVTSVLQWRFWVPFLAVLVAGLLTWRLLRRSPAVAFSLLWIVVFITPVILGLRVFFVGEWIHDRYLYLPCFGICLLVAHLAGYLPARHKFFGMPALSTTLTLVLAAILSFGTAWQEQYWANSLLLFVHAVNAAPNSPWARGYLAAELFHRGDQANASRMYEEGLRLDPGNWKNNVAYATMLYDLGEYRHADQLFTRAIAGDPTDPNAHFNQGLSRLNYGNYTAAEASLREALRRNPNLPKAHYWLGYSLEQQGRYDDARCEYIAEINAHPESSADARQRLIVLGSRANISDGKLGCLLHN